MTGKILPSLVILAGLISTAHAELPPVYYDEARLKAQEAILIEVESVTTKEKEDGSVDVEVKAKVVAVERSKATLKKGAKIVIRYNNRDKLKEPVLEGPSAPVLTKGDFYPAFLKKVEGKEEFAPVALHMSFEMTPAS